MAINDFDPEILQDFLTESGELLEQLESDLVNLESHPTDTDLLNQIFRALHTIKGSASFLALTNLVAIAHAAETALNAARNGEIEIGRSDMDLLLEAVDILKVQFDELGSGETDLTKPDSALVDSLTALGDPNASFDDDPSCDPCATASCSEAADGNGTRSIELDPSKADLIEHLVEDVNQTIEQMTGQLVRLEAEESVSAAGTILTELAEDLVRTIDFFEIGECMRLAVALEQAFAGIETLTNEQTQQVRLRSAAVCSVLANQTTQLREMSLTPRPVGHLIERLGQAAHGELPQDCFVPYDADPESVLAFDSDGAAPEPTATPSADPVPASAAAEPPSPTKSPPPVSPPPEVKPTTGADAPAKRAQVPVEQTIRVEVSRLESLMNLVGELVLEKNRIGAISDDVGKAVTDPDLIEQMEISAGTLDRVTGDIQVAVMRTRMQPLDKLFGKYPRLIRDLATKTGKQIQLVIEGAETEVDKSVIEELGDPLVHLLRNSADHGIESPGDRREAGKDEVGTIRLIAGHEGSHVRVQIIDDGKGLSREVIGNKALERGLVTSEQLEAMPDTEVFRFIFEAGFSTAEQVSDLSGRGVGMDVVRTNIERKLKGSIAIESEPGEGTTLTITIPLTVAIMPAMMVAVGDETFAIPLNNITEIVRPTEDQISTIGENPMIHLRGAVHPLLSGSEVFALPQSEEPDAEMAEEPFVVVIGFNQKIVGLQVTRVIGQQEIVIKPLDGVKREGPISGATVRNDGGVSLIVDVVELMRQSRRAPAGAA